MSASTGTCNPMRARRVSATSEKQRMSVPASHFADLCTPCWFVRQYNFSRTSGREMRRDPHGRRPQTLLNKVNHLIDLRHSHR